MVIRILDYVEHYSTNADGAVIAALVLAALRAGDEVTLSFQGINGLPTSFTNSAIGNIFDELDADFVKSHLKIVDTDRQMNDAIRRSIEASLRNKTAA